MWDRKRFITTNTSSLQCVPLCGSVFVAVWGLQFYKVSVMFFVKVSRQVKVELQDSEYFHVVGSEDARIKVAPGLSATFNVFFTPQENKVLDAEIAL